MDIRRLLSSDTSSPLSLIQAHAPHRSPSRSSPAAPQLPESSPTKVEPDVDEPLNPTVIPASVDPHVAGFLKSALGTRKWRIFSSRLCERKDSLGGGRGNEATSSGDAKGKARRLSTSSFIDDEDGVLHGGTSPCAIAFLVKVEVVKEVLRNYVPNPYHPLKAESHRYPHAPEGVVHVTRASVLSLCQWSNTQFAYWSRRSEAVSVLACHDSGLRDLFYVLYQRLYQRDPPANAFAMPSPATTASWSSAASSSGSPPPTRPANLQGTGLDAQMLEAAELERRLRVARSFTGKGLDGLIAEIKKRTGASQFLRGRQSSLDPFGAHLEPEGTQEQNWPVVLPSFHGKQSHSRTSSDNDFSASPLLISSQPVSSRLPPQASPAMSHKNYEDMKYDDMNHARHHEIRPSTTIPSHHAERLAPRGSQWIRDGSCSPHSRHSRASSAGSKRKRDDDSSGEDENRMTGRFARPRGRATGQHLYHARSSSGSKRTKLDD